MEVILVKNIAQKAILEKCGVGQFIPSQNKSTEQRISNDEKELRSDPEKRHEQMEDSSKLLDTLMTGKEEYNYLPYELRKQKKRKRKSS